MFITIKTLLMKCLLMLRIKILEVVQDTTQKVSEKDQDYSFKIPKISSSNREITVYLSIYNLNDILTTIVINKGHYFRICPPSSYVLNSGI